MNELIITQVRPGVAEISSANPFDKFVIHRIERKDDGWKATPELPGIYLLYGVSPDDGKLTVYIGKSEADMRKRIGKHHVTPAKNWFGVLFAVPVDDSILCPAIEAELIRLVREAGVIDVIANEQDEKRYLDSTNIHVRPAVDEISSGLQLVLGSDIFTSADAEDSQRTSMDKPLPQVPRAVKTIIRHDGSVEDGAEVSLIPETFTTPEQQELVREEMARDARYGEATWINKYPKCLKWKLDGEPHSTSGLIEKMLFDLGFGEQHIQGTVYWRLPNGNSIKEEADALLLQDGTDAPGEGSGTSS